jgi:S1-C subfamily serine protease
MRRLSWVILLVLVGFLAGLVVTGRMAPSETADAQQATAPPPATPVATRAPRGAASGDLPDLADVAAKVIPSVVNISVRGARPRDPFFPFFADQDAMPSAGSGVIIGTDGSVVTNAHVLGNRPESVQVILSDRRQRLAEVVGVDPYTDIALLRIKDREITPITWGDSTRLRVADWVMAIGNPYQLSETVTLGIVSAVGRTNAAMSTVADYIQTDAAINPGNSGGALVNRRGELVGINTWIYSESGGYQGIGFAVPSNTVREVADQLREFGTVRRGFINGIQRITAVTGMLARELGVRSTDGALVYGMLRSGDAYAAGIRVGDIIIGFNDRPIVRPEDFEREMLRAPIGSVATLQVRRGGEEFSVKVPVREASPRR